ncbi:LacI family DNA-binding transcriptional regulator, partial [Sphaerochaeta sp.]
MKLSEVAKHAGVSLATVSRILNNDTSFSVTPET